MECGWLDGTYLEFGIQIDFEQLKLLQGIVHCRLRASAVLGDETQMQKQAFVLVAAGQSAASTAP
jgi:hypothetical protein